MFLTAAQSRRPRDVLLTNQKCSFSRSARQSCLRLNFRTLSGICNNLCDIRQGSTNQPFARLLPPAYDDGVGAPRQAGLPNVRQVSRRLFLDTGDSDPEITHMTMSWGQFLAHDITLAGQPEELDCGRASLRCPNRPECFGIDILNRIDRPFVRRNVRYVIAMLYGYSYTRNSEKGSKDMN